MQCCQSIYRRNDTFKGHLRPLPRYGLAQNNHNSKYCIYAFRKPKEIPKNYIEHRVYTLQLHGKIFLQFDKIFCDEI